LNRTFKSNCQHFASQNEHHIHIGTYGLAQRSALSNCNLITLLNTESWRDMRSKVLVSLLVTGILGDEMEVFSADDESSVHLGGNDGAGQDTTTDGDETGEWALLVCGDQVSMLLSCAQTSTIPLRSASHQFHVAQHANS
jgi:hypothetical protein